jgi:hypothetical protein
LLPLASGSFKGFRDGGDIAKRGELSALYCPLNKSADFLLGHASKNAFEGSRHCLDNGAALFGGPQL